MIASLFVFVCFVSVLAENEYVVLKCGDKYVKFTSETTTELVASSSRATEFIRTNECYLVKWVEGQLRYLNVDNKGKFVLSNELFRWGEMDWVDEKFAFSLGEVTYELESLSRIPYCGFHECRDREAETDYMVGGR